MADLAGDRAREMPLSKHLNEVLSAGTPAVSHLEKLPWFVQIPIQDLYSLQ